MCIIIIFYKLIWFDLKQNTALQVLQKCLQNYYYYYYIRLYFISFNFFWKFEIYKNKYFLLSILQILPKAIKTDMNTN